MPVCRPRPFVLVLPPCVVIASAFTGCASTPPPPSLLDDTRAEASAPNARPGAARPPRAGELAPLTDPASAPWSLVTPPSIPADAISETRDEPVGRRITVSRSPDGRSVWVTHHRAAGRAPLLEHARLEAPLAEGGRVVPLFHLEGADEGAGFVYVEPALSRARYVEPRLDRVALRTLRGERIDDALRATFRARLFVRCPIGRREVCVVLGAPDALYAIASRPDRETAWRIVSVPGPRVPQAPIGDVSRTQAGRGVAGDTQIELRELPSVSRVEPSDEHPWHAWLLRGGRHVFLFGAADGEAAEVGIVAHEERGRRLLFAWAWDPERVRLLAVRLDEGTLAPVETPFALEAQPMFEVECNHVFTDTIPAVVLADDGGPMLAHVWRGQQVSVLYRGPGRAGRVLLARHDAIFYEHPRPGTEAQQPPPLYRLRGAASDPAAWLDPVSAL